VRWKSLIGAIVMAAGALVVGALLGRPGSGHAAATAAPKNTALPTISGTAQVDATLTAGKGTWSGDVKSYAYAWERCDKNGNSCSKVTGATSTTYKLTSADVGTTLRVAVTATNSGGSTTATSVPTAAVPAPVSTGCPAGTGAIQVADLHAPARLAIASWSVAPALTHATSSIALRFRVTACGGRPVEGASVFATAIPYNQFQGTSGTTAADGTVTLNESRDAGFPADHRQELLVVLARAAKPGEPVTGGVSTRRAVSFPVGR